MASSDLPKARQSQLVTTYGVGSLFPAGDQSFMICGIDQWDDKWSPSVEEPRLARSLGVQTFKAPATGKRSGDVPVVRFPTYHYCPECRRLDRYWKFDAIKMQCADCVRDLTPSRFVACCENGHIEDFPYFNWVHRGSPATHGNHQLTLESRGASSSLADIVIRCSCGVAPHDLDGSFARNALSDIKRCGGKRPWLPGTPDETCEKTLRALQRGSSNVWFGAVRSSISIPPWSSPNAQFVTKHWEVLKHLPEDTLATALPGMITGKAGLGVDGIAEVIRQRKGLATAGQPSDADLREEEYRALIDGNDRGALDAFQCVAVDVDARVRTLITQVSKATRLREVRALQGFSRVTPMPTDTTNPRMARLSETHLPWLPATEVFGEGIFIRLADSAVAEWERQSLAVERHDLLAASLLRRAVESGVVPTPAPSARFIAVHSLAHALLQELSLDAGYPVGSLRERIYAEGEQAGLLVYTASSDAAGSLGGLAALADEKRFADCLLAALSRAGWCSNDPVCSESGPSGADGLNLAACHACLLLPETSCDHRNIYLDRVSLVGGVDSQAGALATVITAAAWSRIDPPTERGPAPEVAAEWAQAYQTAQPGVEQELVCVLAGRDEFGPPEIGKEGPDGIALEVSWPAYRLAVDISGMSERDRTDLLGAGWVVVGANADEVVTELRRRAACAEERTED